MSVLSALLARDRVVPPQKIDEAIQRQVINGGDFETNLLEVGAVPEDTLVGYCAAVHDLDPITRDEVMGADPKSIAKVSREVAESHRIVPVRIDGGKLIVACAAPLDDDARRAVEAVAGPIELRITTSFRLAWALGTFYGVETSPRTTRLAQRLDHRPSGSMRAVNPPSSLPPRPNKEPTGPQPKIRPSVLAALSAALTEDRESAVPEASTAQPAPAPNEAPAAPADDAEHSLAALRGRVEKATDRDDVLQALFAFVERRVQYAALFVVHGDVAEGLDARGTGLDAERVRGVAVPLDAPGAFRSVRERGEPVLAPLDVGRTDTVIKSDLGRATAQNVGLLPIHIGGRVALILWCDNGRSALDLGAIDEIATLCVESARAFERIIVDRKRRRTVADTAAAAAAAIAKATLPRVTPADIARRFAEQRGAQALRTLSQPTASDTVESIEPLEEATPPDGVNRPHEAVDAGPVVEERSAPIPREEPAEPEPLRAGGDARVEREPGTRFARGGRVPIAVDVIGPLPSPAMGENRPLPAPPRSYEARPEAPATGTPSDGTIGIVAEIVRSGELSDATANTLLGGGERALASVFRYFPGPTSIDRSNTRARLPPVAEIGPLLRLVVMFRQGSGPHLLQQLESYDAERRYYASLCLGEVVHPPALSALVPRLFDTDYPTAVVTIESLKAYRRFPEFDNVLRTLRATVSDTHAASDKRRIAANVLGEIRDAEAIPSLLVALADRDGALAGIARRSLVVLARQDFGQDSDQWQQWWERAGSKHRVEWLIDGLLHGESNIRHEASEELKKVTGQFFGYYFNLPRRERERAHQRYVEWWNRDGRAKFARG